MNVLDEPHNTRLDRQRRSTNLFIIIVVLFIITVVMGTVGYIYLFNLPWLEALYNASVIITAIDVENKPTTSAQQVFIIFYSFISVILLLSLVNAGMQRLMEIYVYE